MKLFPQDFKELKPILDSRRWALDDVNSRSLAISLDPAKPGLEILCKAIIKVVHEPAIGPDKEPFAMVDFRIQPKKLQFFQTEEDINIYLINNPVT